MAGGICWADPNAPVRGTGEWEMRMRPGGPGDHHPHHRWLGQGLPELPKLGLLAKAIPIPLFAHISTY